MENQTMLEKCLAFIIENKKDRDTIRNLLKSLDMKELTNLLLHKVLSQEIDYREASSIFKAYISYLSIDDKTVFFNTLFYFSKTHQNVDLISLSLEIIDKAALTHNMSVLRTIDFWHFLNDCLVKSKDFLEAQTVTYVLQTCYSLTDTAEQAFQCQIMNNDGHAWKVFLTLAQVLNSGKLELIKPSIELLNYFSGLHYFWKSCIFKILLNHVSLHLKCTVLALMLKQNIEEENLQNFMQLLLPAINERKCWNANCSVFKELSHFCENANVKNYTVVLDEILNVVWNHELVWTILHFVLVDAKKNLVDFKYYFRIEALLKLYDFYGWSDRDTNQLSTFWDSKNFDTVLKIVGSSIPYSCELVRSKELEEKSLLKILELSNKNSDDINEIKKYMAFIEDKKTLFKDYSVSIHVRILIYRNIFRGSGSEVYEMKLDEEKTVNDFYEYLINNLNEKTYIIYRELMMSFLELMNRFISFLYPEKACAEILKIMRNPDLYTKYQVYSATEILRYVDYRFEIDNKYYKEIASSKWKFLIVDTEDEQMCIEGLYYVLGAPGQLDPEEYDKIVKNLLEKHLCDQVTEEIFDQYLNVRLLKCAFSRLKYIMEKHPTKRERFTEFFCKFIFSKKYYFNDQILMENKYLEFCLSSGKNMEYTIKAIKNLEIVRNEDYFFRSMDIQILIYLHNQSNVLTRNVLWSLFTQDLLFLRYMNRQYFKRLGKWTINRFKEMYAANSKNDVIKLRIIQALALMVLYLGVGVRKDSDRLVYHLKRIAVGILVKESKSNNYAVKQICQFMYIQLCKVNPDFKEIKCIIEKVKERPDWAGSFIPVLYHLIPFCNKFSTSQLEEILLSIISLSQGSDKKLRVYTQEFLQRAYNLHSNKRFDNLVQKYEAMLKKTELDIQSNKENTLEILKTDYVFLKIFDLERDNSVDTLLYIFPKLNQVDPSEWKDIMSNNCLSGIVRIYNKTNHLNKAVNLYLDTNGKYINYSAKDILRMFPAPTKNPSFERCQ